MKTNWRIEFEFESLICNFDCEIKEITFLGEKPDERLTLKRISDDVVATVYGFRETFKLSSVKLQSNVEYLFFDFKKNDYLSRLAIALPLKRSEEVHSKIDSFLRGSLVSYVFRK